MILQYQGGSNSNLWKLCAVSVMMRERVCVCVCVCVRRCVQMSRASLKYSSMSACMLKECFDAGLSDLGDLYVEVHR